MTAQRSAARRAWRTFRSFRDAVWTKLVASTKGRKPSSTCQIDSLAEIFAAEFDPMGDGQFVEVGAYDGERFSNTSWLADNGWHGLYLEPSVDYARLCRIRHCFNKTQVLNLAAGEGESEAVLMQIGALSTMCEDTLKEYERLDFAKRMMFKERKPQTTVVRTLNIILTDAGIEPGFELLVVDVEGYEEKVFSGFDLSEWHPQMLIIELHDCCDSFDDDSETAESASRVRQKILAAGYLELYRDSVNTIFKRIDQQQRQVA